MIRNWKKLNESKCPVIGCITNGRKTKLNGGGIILNCPKCKGEWGLKCYSPMDIVWVEIKKPLLLNNKENINEKIKLTRTNDKR